MKIQSINTNNYKKNIRNNRTFGMKFTDGFLGIIESISRRPGSSEKSASIETLRNVVFRLFKLEDNNDGLFIAGRYHNQPDICNDILELNLCNNNESKKIIQIPLKEKNPTDILNGIVNFLSDIKQIKGIIDSKESQFNFSSREDFDDYSIEVTRRI